LLEERFVLKEESPNQRIDKGLYFFSWEKTRKSSGYMIQKHVAFCPSESKATRIQALLSSPVVEEPCPLSLSHGFFTIQPSLPASLFFDRIIVKEKR
jgi:hypothetical protein